MAPDRAELDAILDRPDPADAAPDTSVDTPEPEAPADTPAAETEAQTPEDPWESGADTFERPYVEGLRRENQRYRQRAKRYEEVFDGYNDDERDFLLTLASEVRSNPAQAAQRAAQLAQVLGASPAEQRQVAHEVDESGPLTGNDIAAIIDRQLSARDQRQAAQQQAQQAQEANEAAIGDVFKSAEAMGYHQDTPELIELLYVAANETDNDLKAADSAIKGRRQKIIDDYLAQKAKESDQTPDTRTPGGSAPSGENKIGSIADATRALRASNLAG